MASKKPDIVLIGFETRTDVYYPLVKEVKRWVGGVEKLVKIPVPPCEQISFIKKLRADGIKEKLKPRFRRLRSKRKGPIARTENHA